MAGGLVASAAAALALLCAPGSALVMPPSSAGKPSRWASALRAVAEVRSPIELDLIHRGTNKFCVVNFGNTVCGPCEVMRPKYEKLSKEFGSEGVFLKCDFDKSKEATTLAKREKVTKVPSVHIWRREADGKIAKFEVVEGPQPALLRAAIERAAGGVPGWGRPLARISWSLKTYGLFGAIGRVFSAIFRKKQEVVPELEAPAEAPAPEQEAAAEPVPAPA